MNPPAAKSRPLVVAVVQAAPVWLNLDASVDKACGLIAQAARDGARVIAFAESFLPAFPYGAWHHGLHRNQAFHRALYEQAVEIPGPAIDQLGKAARAAQAVVVMGMTERAGGTLYNTQAFFGADGSLLGTRRKLKPTSAERLVWGEGDGSGMRVFATPISTAGSSAFDVKLGGLMCGEHNFALARYTLQSLGEEIHVASYPDPLMEGKPFADRLEAAVRHYAAEGQCFVLNATGYIDDAIRAAAFDTPEAAAELQGAGARNGASSIIAPDGRTLAGPLSGAEGILLAQIDLANIAYAKFWFDAAGHSGRHDIFRLQVDFSPRTALVGETATGLVRV
jgi:aliphatic nitrilase